MHLFAQLRQNPYLRSTIYTKNMTRYLLIVLASMSVLSVFAKPQNQPVLDTIDRHALLQRNNPHVVEFDSLSTLTVGNGSFAFSVDATGLQTFPQQYSKGVPLGTMSDWGWHSFPNTEGYRFEETLVESDFGRGHKEIYASQTSRAQEAAVKASGDSSRIAAFQRRKDAINFVRQNPHRLHLGTVGFLVDGVKTLKGAQNGYKMTDFTDIDQTLDLETGLITSNFKLRGKRVKVQTCVSPEASALSFKVEASTVLPIVASMPYPTGGHSDDACRWVDDKSLHFTYDKQLSDRQVQLTHWFPKVDRITEFGIEKNFDASYRLTLTFDCKVSVIRHGDNRIIMVPEKPAYQVVAQWMPEKEKTLMSKTAEAIADAAAAYWRDYWYKGAVIDFSRCKAPEAKELERRVVLSQYLLAVNCAGNTPPQETGLTYNSWFGKYHMEMIWWHQAQFALYGHPELLEKSMEWYAKAEPVAREIARRQGFKGVRWMKMTDPSGLEAPSSTGSYLIWQQPHYIYLAELVRRAYASKGQSDKPVFERYYDLVQRTAEFMADFAVYDTMPNRYILKGAIPAQETLKASTTINSPFELSQWHFAMGVANEWRQRRKGLKNLEWDELRDKLSPLAYAYDSTYSARYGKLYLASEDSEDTYLDVRLTSDHMAVLGALGVFPKSPLVREDIMRNTLRWVWDNWNWGKTWGWDYPMTAMCAARLGEPEMAVKVLLGNKRTNTYLVSGHNYQDSRLRLYLPGNGGLLTAVAMMCAGWDGCQSGENPGFPKDGNWDVRWENLLPLP